MTTTITYDEALARIHAIELAAQEYGLARANEIEFADERAIAKTEAIRALIGTPNELSNDKPHTFSSSETRVEENEAYRRLRVRQADNLLQQQLWYGRLKTAELRAQLAVQMVGSPNGTGGAP